MMKILVTEENIDVIRNLIPEDQAQILKVGCITWRTYLDDDKGSMCFITVWPDSSRGAVSWGTRCSLWGNWDDKDQMISLDFYNNIVNENGVLF